MSENGPQTTDAVDRVYASALFEMAEAGGWFHDVADDVEQLAQLLDAQPDLQRLLSSLALAVDQRAAVIERVFQNRIGDVLYRFLQVVNKKDRLGSIRGILNAFDDLIDERRGVVEVNVHVARRLDDAGQRKVAQAMGSALGKQVVVHQYVDPDIIGGLVIRVGDRLIDGSVATQLKLLKRKVLDRGRDLARRGGVSDS